jgi:hypothetical protein
MKKLTLQMAGIICLDDVACLGFSLERLSSIDQDGFFEVHFMAGNTPGTSYGPKSEPPGFVHFIKQPGAKSPTAVSTTVETRERYTVAHESSISLASIIATDEFGVRGNDGMELPPTRGPLGEGDATTTATESSFYLEKARKKAITGVKASLAAAQSQIEELKAKLASTQATTSRALLAQKLAEQDASRAENETHAQILKIKAMTTELKRLYVSEAVLGAKLEKADSNVVTGFRQAFKNEAKVLLSNFHHAKGQPKESEEQFEEFEKFITVLVGVGIMYAIYTCMVYRPSTPLPHKRAMLPHKQSSMLPLWFTQRKCSRTSTTDWSAPPRIAHAYVDIFE